MKNNCYITVNSILLTLGILLFSSCTRNISSDFYASPQVGEVSATYAGVIKSVRSVTVNQGEQLEENGLGIAGGGIAGGVIGNSIGRGNFAPTAAGAIVGAVAGSLIERNLKRQCALEYVVQFENGGLMTLVQGQDQVFNVGQPVFVIVSQTGRSRIIPQ